MIPRTYEAHRIRQELQATRQREVNDAERIEQSRMVRRIAAEAHASYPQYRGHWDDHRWRLVQITNRVTTKAGVAFEAGDITIARRSWSRGDWIAYSIRNGVDTRIDHYVQKLTRTAIVQAVDARLNLWALDQDGCFYAEGGARWIPVAPGEVPKSVSTSLLKQMVTPQAQPIEDTETTQSDEGPSR